MILTKIITIFVKLLPDSSDTIILTNYGTNYFAIKS